ncbi:MAG: RDD family protein [Granulosicoccus sp.]
MQKTHSTVNLLLRRAAAFFYDSLLLVALFFFITSAALTFNNGQAIEHWSYKLLLLFVAFLFFDWFWRHGGQTLGMRAWRIKLVSAERSLITLNQTLIRFASGAFLFGLTLLFMLANDRSEAIHDRLSRTNIIFDNS